MSVCLFALGVCGLLGCLGACVARAQVNVSESIWLSLRGKADFSSRLKMNVPLLLSVTLPRFHRFFLLLLPLFSTVIPSISSLFS